MYVLQLDEEVIFVLKLGNLAVVEDDANHNVVLHVLLRAELHAEGRALMSMYGDLTIMLQTKCENMWMSENSATVR